MTRASFIAALTQDAAAEIYDPGGTPVYGSPVAVPGMPWKTNLSRGYAMGFVREAATGAGLDGAVLTLAGPVNRTLRTDATGFYGSVDLPAGSYTLSITVPGSLPQRADFSVGNALVAEHAFELQPQPLDFISSSRDALRRMVLTWHSRPGQTYRIEVSTDLGGWTPAEPVWISQGWSTSWTSPVPPPGTERQFFRIVEI